MPASANSGDAFRDQVADLLAAKYGDMKVELRASGKKVDIYFTEQRFNKTHRVYVEVKNYESALHRKFVTTIWADYSGILSLNAPASLLLVSANGLTPDADAYVNQEQHQMMHQTYLELENDIIGLGPDTEHLAAHSEASGLARYYVDANASRILPAGPDESSRELPSVDLLAEIDRWIDGQDSAPIALLGGYGAGKTTFAEWLAATLAQRAIRDPQNRRPVLIRLGQHSRQASLESLLGSLFTLESPVSSFNVKRFLSFNDKGRLLIILDGFDEMKHLMSWADFRAQVMELGRLIGPTSRVLLLGRPTAFLSEDEHLQILRGIRRSGEFSHQIDGWPTFQEYRLTDFRPDDQVTFARRYLAYRRGGDWSASFLSSRLSQVESLIQRGQDIFGKPVHLKMLVDLASSQSFPLSDLSDRPSRWRLYENFLKVLMERETEKLSRRPISEASRGEFLGRLAMWLWADRLGAINFSVVDLPDAILDDLPPLDAEPDEKKREYLTVPFIERKNGDFFYFQHRSFVEFLVAEHMLRHPPGSADHTRYNRHAHDAVLTFLLECPHAHKLQRWAETLEKSRASISLEYLRMIADSFPDTRSFVERVGDNSPISAIVLALESVNWRIDKEDIWKHILSIAASVNDGRFLGLYYLLILSLGVETVISTATKEYITPRLSAILLDRLFLNSTSKMDAANVFRKHTVSPEHAETLGIARASIVARQSKNGQVIDFQWSNLGPGFLDITAKVGIDIVLAGRGGVRLPTGLTTLPVEHVYQHMSKKGAEQAQNYFRKERDLGAIEIEGVLRN